MSEVEDYSIVKSAWSSTKERGSMVCPPVDAMEKLTLLDTVLPFRIVPTTGNPLNTFVVVVLS